MRNSYLRKTSFLFFGLLVFFLLSFNCLAENQPTVWNLSHGNLFFVGREEQIQTIRAFFRKGDRRVLALTGGAGFGKTQIAKRFAQKFADDYDLIWWFDSQQDIPSQFEKLAAALNTLLPVQDKINPSTMSKQALIDTVKNVLRLKPISYLFVFDNPENYKQIENYIPYAHNNTTKRHVLLTSRNANIWVDVLPPYIRSKFSFVMD